MLSASDAISRLKLLHEVVYSHVDSIDWEAELPFSSSSLDQDDHVSFLLCQAVKVWLRNRPLYCIPTFLSQAYLSILKVLLQRRDPYRGGKAIDFVSRLPSSVSDLP